ncbi:MAG: lysine 2,3-aminomutase, partial [Clostridiales bacterium]|nr:lysine 2,3-aminomutase [Clostridiales bacterium]
KGIEIIEALRGHTSGYAVPTFVVDAPGGGGKIPVSPTYLISHGAGKVILRNYEGVFSAYTEPRHYKETCRCDVCAGKTRAKSEGIAGLAMGHDVSIEPAYLRRHMRNEKPEGQ